jgi:hypothetical protein
MTSPTAQIRDGLEPVPVHGRVYAEYRVRDGAGISPHERMAGARSLSVARRLTSGSLCPNFERD